MSYGDYHDKKQLREMAAKARAEGIPWVKKMINSTLFLQNPERRQGLLKFLSLMLQLNVKEDHPYVVASTQEQISQGVYILCDVITGKGPEYPARIKRIHLPLHGACTGPTGSGKTTVLIQLAKAIHRDGLDPHTGKRTTSVWFFDTEGQIPAFLAAAGAVGCHDILIIHVKEMSKLNRWKAPAGISQKEHITKLTIQDRETRYMRDYMMYVLRDAAFELLNRQGIFNERQLLEHISSKKCKPGSREFMAKESLINRLRDPLEYLASVYDTNRSHDLHALTGRSIVWDLHDLPSDHVAMFVGDLLLRLQEIMPVFYEPELRLVLIFDEFSHVCNIRRLQRADLKEPYMLDAFRTFRKRGICLLIGSQEPFSVPGVILSNIDGFWMAFRPTDGYSARILSENLALNRDQLEYMMQMPERQAVCRTKDCPQPFLGSIPEINPPVATEAEIAERIEYTQQVLDSLLEPEPEADQLSLFSEKPSEEQAQTLFGYYNLTKPCLDYLEFLSQPAHLFLPVSELDKIDSLSAYKANLIRQQLQETGPGLIRVHRIATGKKGGPLSVVEITEAGYHLLAKLGVDCDQPVGHAGVEHNFWQYTIYRWAIARGYPAKIEHWLNNKSVDVGVQWDERKVAVEVALEDMEKEITNLIRDLEAGWDKVIFAVLSDKELNRLKNEIAKRFGSSSLEDDKVGFMKLKTFLERRRRPQQTDSQSNNQKDIKTDT